MNRKIAFASLAFSFASMAMAAEFKGFVEDEMCSKMPAMKDDAQCAQKCIKGGSPAVLVTEAGRIYKIGNQAKIAPHAGMKVTVTGTLKGDTITVEGVK